MLPERSCRHSRRLYSHHVAFSVLQLVLTPASVSFFTSAFMSVSLSVYKRSGSIIAAHPSGCAVHALIWQHIQWACCVLSASAIEVPKPEARRLRSLVTHPVSSFSRGALMNMYTGNGHKTMKSVLHAAYMRVNKTSVFQIASSVPHSVEAFVGGIALISSSALKRSMKISTLVNRASGRLASPPLKSSIESFH